MYSIGCAQVACTPLLITDKITSSRDPKLLSEKHRNATGQSAETRVCLQLTVTVLMSSTVTEQNKALKGYQKARCTLQKHHHAYDTHNQMVVTGNHT